MLQNCESNGIAGAVDGGTQTGAIRIVTAWAIGSRHGSNQHSFIASVKVIGPVVPSHPRDSFSKSTVETQTPAATRSFREQSRFADWLLNRLSLGILSGPLLGHDG